MKKKALIDYGFGELLDAFEAAIRLNHYDPMLRLPDPGYSIDEIREELVNRS